MKAAYEYHTPVLLEEVVELLVHKSDGTFLDGTLGGGGHFLAMAERLTAAGTLIGIDRDPEAVAWNRDRLAPCRPRIIIEKARYSEFDRVLAMHHISSLDGMLLDLGVSSRQIDAASRGFSYRQDGPLDMRMDPATGMPAHELLRKSSDEELTAILREFGEVEHAGRIARGIKHAVARKPIVTSSDLRTCCASLLGNRIPVKLLSRIFQALRIAVNNELGELKVFLDKVLNFLRPNGRLAIISYHSLEDRMVKEYMRRYEGGCVCPPQIPVCVCNKVSLFKRLTKKAIRPSEGEVALNPRSRSARLRVGAKTGGQQ